ncbi:MAG: repeat protein [Verrucomicrobiales bacterium]|nr:repeat protein [Verrucomicrobiales bacterium]
MSLAIVIVDLLSNPGWLISSPFLIISAIFQLWMAIDAFRRGETMWGFIILFFTGFAALFYYLTIYRSQTRGFEFPGAFTRKKKRELEAKIHHLDKAHHYYELGNLYFLQGKLPKAAQAFEASLQRDATDIDARAHYGQCLLRMGKKAEALSYLEPVCRENPKHDYGHSLMSCAEALAETGKRDLAILCLLQVLDSYLYARARVQLATLYVAAGEKAKALEQVTEAISEDHHAPGFQRRRDRFWVRKAKKIYRQLR